MSHSRQVHMNAKSLITGWNRICKWLKELQYKKYYAMKNPWHVHNKKETPFREECLNCKIQWKNKVILGGKNKTYNIHNDKKCKMLWKKK